MALVPSGPTKLNGPDELLLPAAWNFSVVLAGVVPVHDKVVQFGVAPIAGLLSLTEEVKSPEAVKPVDM